jgi:hypothetical protein
MKNLFGLMPGTVYGWPKNVLHMAGIESSILDIVATVRPHLAIVDGIVGMEGDGPILGDPRAAGVLVMGTSFPAVDATAAAASASSACSPRPRCALTSPRRRHCGDLSARPGLARPLPAVDHGRPIGDCPEVP